MNKEDIFAIVDVVIRPVEVKEWNKTVYVKSMNGTDRAKFCFINAGLQKADKGIESDTWLVLFGMCDMAGNRVFADSDFDRLNNMNASVISKIAREALIVNGLLNEQVEEAKN
jgi:hypothetical protein